VTQEPLRVLARVERTALASAGHRCGVGLWQTLRRSGTL
jgi:hypothetical protein